MQGLARRWGLDIPAWADDPRRFLDKPHFPDYMELAKPVFLRDSPIAFRRRLIFTEAEPRRRARFPREGWRPSFYTTPCFAPAGRIQTTHSLQVDAGDRAPREKQFLQA